jgi:hypothetical protein
MTRNKTIALCVAAILCLVLLVILLRDTREAAPPSSAATPAGSGTAQPSPMGKPVEAGSAASAPTAAPAPTNAAPTQARPTAPRPSIASPDFVRADAFRRVVDDSLRACLPNESLVGLACDDPFCAAVIRVGPGAPLRSLGDCEAWQRAYGGTIGAGWVAVPCPDGREEILEIIHPEPDVWSGWHALPDDEKIRLLRSLQDGAQQLVDDHACKR